MRPGRTERYSGFECHAPHPNPLPAQSGERELYTHAAATFGTGREIASTINAATMHSAPATKKAGR